ncbi:MAG: tetratricopeptide repeat protein [Bacteroidota bacterium]
MRNLAFLWIFFIVFLFSGKAQNDTNTVIALHNKIKVFQESDQVDSIWLYENKALAISEKIHYEYGIAHALSTFGVIYRIRGDYPKSLENFFKALTIYEKTHNQYRILVQLSGIAAVYYFQNDLKKAKKYYLDAIALSRFIGDKRIESDNLCNLAGIYNDIGDFANAEKCLNEALKIDQSMKNDVGIAHVLVDLGQLHLGTKEYEKTLSFAREALALCEKIEYGDIIPTCYNLLGEASFGLKKNKDAEEYYLKALNTSKAFHDMNEKMQIENNLSHFYSTVGNADKAFIHFKTYILYKDSMYNEESTKKSVETEMNYEFNKKQAALKYENDKIVYQLEADNRLHKQWRLFFIVIILLALIGLFFGKRAYDNKKKLAVMLAAKDQRKDILLQEVHHRINNNLQIISSLLTLQANNAENEKLTEYLVQSQNRIQSLSALHELLYDTNSPLDINMKDYISRVLDFHREVAGSMSVRIDIQEEIESVNLPTKLAVPIALIINELVTNSLKYAFTDKADGIIKVTLKKMQNTHSWEVIVRDNGIGMPSESEKRKESLGLKLVNIMTKQIKGTFLSGNDGGAFSTLVFDMVKTTGK